jgi:RES domain-containing protein
MEVFRLSRAAFAGVLSGSGAALKGARWNPPGIELVYTAANRSLAMAEVAVHLTIATLPPDYQMLTIYVPDDIPVATLPPEELPAGWNAFPYGLSTQRFGEAFVRESRFCILKVPSAVTKGDHNFLINPRHTHFPLIRIISREDFPFDRRMWGEVKK